MNNPITPFSQAHSQLNFHLQKQFIDAIKTSNYEDYLRKVREIVKNTLGTQQWDQNVKADRHLMENLRTVFNNMETSAFLSPSAKRQKTENSLSFLEMRKQEIEMILTATSSSNFFGYVKQSLNAPESTIPRLMFEPIETCIQTQVLQFIEKGQAIENGQAKFDSNLLEAWKYAKKHEMYELKKFCQQKMRATLHNCVKNQDYNPFTSMVNAYSKHVRFLPNG